MQENNIPESAPKQAQNSFHILISRCPVCGRADTQYVGKHNGKARYECPDCDGMQFDAPTPKKGGGA